jgi:hypothetical protein
LGDIAELAKRQGLEVKVISELMQRGLKTERWLIVADRRVKSEVWKDVEFKVEPSLEDLA